MAGQWPQHGSGRLIHGSGLFRDMFDDHFFRDPFASDPFFTQPFGGSLFQSFFGRTRPQPHGTSLLDSFIGGTGMGFPSASRQRREQELYREETSGPMIEEMLHDDEATGASGVHASDQQHIVEEPDDTEEEKAENARLKELLAMEQAAASSHHYSPQMPRQPSVRNIVVTDGASAVGCTSTSTYMYDGSGPGRFQSTTAVSSVGPDGEGRSAVRKRGGEAEERVTARGQPARAGGSFHSGRHLGQQNARSRHYSGLGD